MSGTVTGPNRRYIAPFAAVAAAGALALWISSSRTQQAETEFKREARLHQRHSTNDAPLKQEIRERLKGERDTGQGAAMIKLHQNDMK